MTTNDLFTSEKECSDYIDSFYGPVIQWEGPWKVGGKSPLAWERSGVWVCVCEKTQHCFFIECLFRVVQLPSGSYLGLLESPNGYDRIFRNS